MPIGIPFAAETPEEIAISILAKIIDTRNKFKKS
jgi:xanthine/CO dehydrogenase XdhC/CoxF family maturation factor